MQSGVGGSVISGVRGADHVLGLRRSDDRDSAVLGAIDAMAPATPPRAPSPPRFARTAPGARRRSPRPRTGTRRAHASSGGARPATRGPRARTARRRANGEACFDIATCGARRELLAQTERGPLRVDLPGRPRRGRRSGRSSTAPGRSAQAERTGLPVPLALAVGGRFVAKGHPGRPEQRLSFNEKRLDEAVPAAGARGGRKSILRARAL